MSPTLLPQPSHVTPSKGTFLIQPGTCLFPDPIFVPEARLLAGQLNRGTGYSMQIVDEPFDPPVIRLRQDPRLSGEAYQLEVTSDKAEVCAGTREGIFRGSQTLLQLLPPSIFSSGPRPDAAWTLPEVRIADEPRFQWRGAMLDVARYFAPVDQVLQFLDALAMHKLNVFHWHLTDDQGWRVEIRRYPELTAIGSQRHETIRGHARISQEGNGIPHGGFYTQEDIRRVVAYAAERHIQVIPEIDMPGHMTAAIAAYPWLGCSGKKVAVSTRWGVHEDILMPSEEVIEFFQNVLLEIIELFPSPWIHLGGDEAVKTQWDASAVVQQRMAELGQETADRMQSYFLRRMNTFLRSQGRRMIGWDEVLEGGAPEEAVIMSWRGEEGGIAAAQAGHEVIMTPHRKTYFDYYQSAEPQDEPLAISTVKLPLEEVRHYDPIPSVLNEEERKRVLGIQGQLWREYIPTWEHVQYMAFPRLCALAEVGWSTAQDAADDFPQRLKKHLKRLDCAGIRYRPPDWS